MKVSAEHKPVERVATQGGTTFTIKPTPKAFSILSSGLYSDKILAIVRELSCNAYDAHIKSGKKDVPFEMTLPTQLNPTFIIRDFGTGLSDEQIRGTEVNGIRSGGIYTTFFDSDKSDSNDFIGALGLGSKSPFSYSHTFFVTSRHNGVINTYTMFINEEGAPEVQLMSTDTTTEPNGLTVELAVRKDDIDKFYTAARRALMYFNPIPVVKGRSDFQPYFIEHTYGNDQWKIRRTENYSNIAGPYVVQGFVSYPIDFGQLGEQYQDLNKLNLDIYVDIGEVDVAASREQLSYDKRTVANIEKKMLLVQQQIRDSFQKDIDTWPTLWLARVNHTQNRNSTSLGTVYSKLHTQQEFLWNGQSLDADFECQMQYKTFSLLKIYGRAKRFGSKFDRKAHTSVFWTPQSLEKVKTIPSGVPTYLVLVEDVQKLQVKAFHHIVDHEIRTRDGLIIRFEPNTTEADRAAEIEHFCKQLGDVVPTYMSQHIDKMVEQHRRTSKKYKAKAADEFNVWKGYHNNSDAYSAWCWYRETIDLNDGGYYFPTDKLSIVDSYKSNTPVDSVDDLLKAAREFIRIPTGIIGVPAKRFETLPTDGSWKNVFEVIGEFLKSNKRMLCDAALALNLRKMMGAGLTQMLTYQWPTVCYTMVDCGLKTAFQTLHDQILNTELDAVQYQQYYEVVKYFPLSTVNILLNNPDRRTLDARDHFLIEWNKFPMLKMIDYTEDLDINSIIEYVNAIIAVHGQR